MYELFGPPNGRNMKKQHRYNNRGSSGVWNDEKEFLTPIPQGGGKAYNPHHVQHEEVSSFDQGHSLSSVLASKALVPSGFGHYAFKGPLNASYVKPILNQTHAIREESGSGVTARDMSFHSL
jgi:hypothetical protein